MHFMYGPSALHPMCGRFVGVISAAPSQSGRLLPLQVSGSSLMWLALESSKAFSSPSHGAASQPASQGSLGNLRKGHQQAAWPHFPSPSAGRFPGNGPRSLWRGWAATALFNSERVSAGNVGGRPPPRSQCSTLAVRCQVSDLRLCRDAEC